MTRAEAGPAAAIGVLVVDDSPVQRRFLRTAIAADPAFRVVGEARNGREAVALVDRLRPAIVLMDLDLPVMNGIEAIERIMASHPTPIVVYSAYVDGPDSPNARAATAAGAVDIVAKPAPGEHVGLEDYARDLRSKLRVASRARVITHPLGRLRQSGFSKSTNGAAVVTNRSGPVRETKAEMPTLPVQITALSDPVRVVVIGASTGGPQALAQLLTALPADFEPAVLVIQHMADGFIESLAGWLNEMSALNVAVGESGRKLEPGTVTVAPSGLNMFVHDRRLRVTCSAPPPSQFHVPGIDTTFRSVADNVGADAIGVLLTGMGRDGAVGLKAMHDRGATTIAQDEATSAVYGMPAAAVALGAVNFTLPLPAIAPALLSLIGHEAAPMPSTEEVGA
jgi:two-component system chemotaxis response regulator CheB